LIKFKVCLDDKTLKVLERIASALERPKAPLPKFKLRRVQLDMAQFNDFVTFVAPVKPEDVAKRNIRVWVDTSTDRRESFLESVAPFGEVGPIGPLNIDDRVTLAVSDVDAAGNSTTFVEASPYTVVDNVAPMSPDPTFTMRREQL
jgi:hypothetical protein